MEDQILTPVQTSPVKKVNNWLLRKIETREDAIHVIRNSSNVFYTIAAFDFVVGLIILFVPYFENLDLSIVVIVVTTSITLAVFAYLLRKYKSLLIAVLLLILSILSLIAAIMNAIDIGVQISWFFPALAIFASIRSVQAIHKIHELERTANQISQY
jgi:hypothetical protein